MSDPSPHCSGCGGPLPAAALFCPACGQPSTAAETLPAGPRASVDTVPAEVPDQAAAETLPADAAAETLPADGDPGDDPLGLAPTAPSQERPPDAPLTNVAFDQEALQGARAPSWKARPPSGRPAAAADPDDPLVGREVAGRFSVTARLGQGGMGTVYLAQQTAVGRQVVLKFLRRGQRRQPGPGMTRRFQREAQAASQLQSPNTIIVHDFGQTDDGRLYMAMEYLEGRSLGDELRRAGRLSPVRALAIALQVLGSLEEAHDKGIVHRDLKPDNIMLLSRGGSRDFVKVLDFGIAKLMGLGETPMVTPAAGVPEASPNAGPVLTLQGELFGSPGYMAPEQVSGEAVDGRTDLYALGVILYRMLTGVLPITGQTIGQVLLATVSEPVKPLSEVRPELGIPAALDALVLRCLAKEPDARPESAAELSAALRALTPELERLARRQERALLELAGIRRAWPRWVLPAVGAPLLVLLALGVWRLSGEPALPGTGLMPGERVFVAASAPRVPSWVQQPPREADDGVTVTLHGLHARQQGLNRAQAAVVGRLADIPRRFDPEAERALYLGDLDQLVHHVAALPPKLLSELGLRTFWARFAAAGEGGSTAPQYDVSAHAPRPPEALRGRLQQALAAPRRHRYAFLFNEALRRKDCPRARDLAEVLEQTIRQSITGKTEQEQALFQLRRALQRCDNKP